MFIETLTTYEYSKAVSISGEQVQRKQLETACSRWADYPFKMRSLYVYDVSASINFHLTTSQNIPIPIGSILVTLKVISAVGVFDVLHYIFIPNRIVM